MPGLMNRRAEVPRAVGDEPCEGQMRDGSPCPHAAQATVRYTCANENVRQVRFCRMHVRLLEAGELYCLACHKKDKNSKHPLILLKVQWDK